MKHVFVETNWVFDICAPAHRKLPLAVALLEQARSGETTLYLPSICLREAERTIRRKCQPTPARELREFRRSAKERQLLTEAESEAAIRFLNLYSQTVSNEIDGVPEAIAALRTMPGVVVFPMDEATLERAIELSYIETPLKPFDETILAAVLTRSAAIVGQGTASHTFFCERDGDLQPWNKDGLPKPTLKRLFDEARVYVSSEYHPSNPTLPPDW